MHLMTICQNGCLHCTKASTERVFQLRPAKDTEALVAEGQVPQVDAQIVGRQKRFLVAVHRQRVDVVRVRVGKHAPRARLDHGVGRHKRRNTQGRYRRRIALDACVVLQVKAFRSFVTFTQFPQLHRLICITSTISNSRRTSD